MEHIKGTLSINSDNLMPIIKKWLYSDKDIFIREMVSNATDAISKYKKLVLMGEAKDSGNEEYKILVVVNKKEKTLKFIDNGIGMTAEEVEKYINQVAFSGAVEFIEKYKDKTDVQNDIIGHFGLGFYSAFMVADKVQIDTLSWQEGAEAVRWISADGVEYEMTGSDKKERGTEITLYINNENKEFLDESEVRKVLKKYCGFMPYEIFLEEAGKGTKKAAKKDDNSAEESKPEPINDTNPLWLKKPSDCTDEEYKEFYRKTFMDFSDPLFWIHLNMDYPFRLKGILYFPRLRHEFELNEGQVKLFNNQVFVADNVKEVIPEFLLLLKGAIDCPDLPLNVSRSFLQNDGFVQKISAHITRKVADKLKSLYKDERENYEKYWDDINPFVKYGCMKEEKFYERVKDCIIFKTTNNDYVLLNDYLERNKDKHKDKVFYVTDEKQQAQYIKMFRDQGMEALILNSLLDTHFIQFLEMKNSNISFSRVDSDIADNMKAKAVSEDTATDEAVMELFKEILKDDKLKISVESLKSDSVPAILLLSERSRRLQEFSRMYGTMGLDTSMFPAEEKLVLNRSNSLIKMLGKLKNDENRKNDVELIVRHVYDLAVMSQKQLEPENMSQFIERSNRLLTRLVLS